MSGKCQGKLFAADFSFWAPLIVSAVYYLLCFVSLAVTRCQRLAMYVYGMSFLDAVLQLRTSGYNASVFLAATEKYFIF